MPPPPATDPTRSTSSASESSSPQASVPFSHLARAAYCPRQLYYARREDDFDPPPEVAAVRDLAFEYEQHRAATDDVLQRLPIAVTPKTYRSRLASLARRADYDRLTDPERRDAFISGKDCHGIAHKVLEPSPASAPAETEAPDSENGPNPAANAPDGDDPPPTPSIVSPGDPPPQGVWEPQRVRAVAVAKALAWERGRAIPRALVEYPAHGVVRTVRLTTRNKSAYRRTLWTVKSQSGVPARIRDSAKCEACDYRTTCGTKTRSLKTLLGLG